MSCKCCCKLYVGSCDSRNVIYLISCKFYGKQFDGPVTDFKEGFRVQKTDINTGKGAVC